MCFRGCNSWFKNAPPNSTTLQSCHNGTEKCKFVSHKQVASVQRIIQMITHNHDISDTAPAIPAVTSLNSYNSGATYRLTATFIPANKIRLICGT